MMISSSTTTIITLMLENTHVVHDWEQYDLLLITTGIIPTHLSNFITKHTNRNITPIILNVLSRLIVDLYKQLYSKRNKQFYEIMFSQYFINHPKKDKHAYKHKNNHQLIAKDNITITEPNSVPINNNITIINDFDTTQTDTAQTSTPQTVNNDHNTNTPPTKKKEKKI